MTRTPIRIFILFTGLSFTLICCKQAKKEAGDASIGITPVKIDITSRNVPPDSSPVFTTYPVLEPEIIKAGSPKITIAHNNIHAAGEPVILKEEIPKKIIPGVNSFDLPQIIPVEFKTVPCLNRPLQKALKPRNVENSDYNLQYLDIEHGLSSNEILAIYQDKRGNFWFGTNGEGVVKYDGTYFSSITVRDGLPHNWVRCILEDDKGNTWFGTDDGLVKYDGIEFTWVIIKEDTAAPDIRINIRSMAMDNAGNVWLGTFDAGIIMFDGKNFSRYSEKQGIGKSVTSLLKDSKGNLWFGSNYQGICKYDGKVFDLYTQNKMWQGNRINSITEDAVGNIWVGTTGGVSKFNQHFFSNYTSAQGLPLSEINCISVDNSGNLWMGTEGGGACKFDGKAFTYYTVKEGFRNNQVRYIFQDKSGIYWFATFGGGIMKQNEKGFTHFSSINELNQTIVYSISEDNKGSTWFGTQNGSIIKYSRDTFYTYSKTEGFDANIVRDILQDRNGNMWFASQDGLLCMFDGKSFAYYTINSGSLIRGYFSLYEDKKGNIWIGTLHQGVLKFDGHSFTHLKFDKRDDYEDIWSILEDKNGNMWFGSRDGILTKYDGKNFTTYNQFKGSRILNIIEDSIGNIWFITETSSSLVKYDGKKFYQYTAKQGLIDNRFTSLVQDTAGNFWIGTMRGLNYVENPNGKEGSNTKTIRFGTHDGLIGEEFQQKSALIDSKGNAWWGTNKSVNKLDLRFINQDTTTPVMQLNAITVNGLDVDFHHLNDSYSDSTLPSSFKKIKYPGTERFLNYPINPKIPFKLNHLTFYFTSFDWAAPGKLKYSYKVESLDDKWSELSEESFADYRNIPYGKYTFKLKAIGAAGKWSNIFEYPFTISPPWWHTWWFRSIVILILLSSIYLYTRYRTRSLLERQKYLQLTVDKRTEQLRISLNEKEALLKEIHHRVKNNLEVISSLLKLQTKNVNDENAKAALIERQNRVQSIALIHHKLYSSDDMANIEVIDFANGLFKHINNAFKKPGDKIEFIASGNETTVNTDTAVPVGLILNELFTNAFKYAIDPDRENIISLQIKETIIGDKAIYQMIFSDNGPGMPENFILEKSKSLGMKVIQLLTKQLGGELNYYNKDGAVFEISFPKPDTTSHQKI
jgi:two-component sensor histidine kinase/ligand-binding sensor domain-containing protein